MEKDNNILKLVDELIKEERDITSNSFLSTRIMASVDAGRNDEYVQLLPVWKTVLVSLGLFVAVFGGIAAGNLYQASNSRPDVVLMNDDAMEMFSFFQQTENE